MNVEDELERLRQENATLTGEVKQLRTDLAWVGKLLEVIAAVSCRKGLHDAQPAPKSPQDGL